MRARQRVRECVPTARRSSSIASSPLAARRSADLDADGRSSAHISTVASSASTSFCLSDAQYAAVVRRRRPSRRATTATGIGRPSDRPTDPPTGRAFGPVRSGPVRPFVRLSEPRLVIDKRPRTSSIKSSSYGVGSRVVGGGATSPNVYRSDETEGSCSCCSSWTNALKRHASRPERPPERTDGRTDG